MKKLALALSFIFCALPALAQKTQLTGTLKLPDGTGFNGYLYLSLAQVAAISPDNGCGGSVLALPTTNVVIKFVNGSMVNAPKVFGSDCTLPVGVPYDVVAKDNNGNTLFTDQWLIAGATQDIGTINTCDGCAPRPPTTPQSATAAAGFCINGYNAVTGTWTYAACATGTGGTVSNVTSGTTPSWLSMSVANSTTSPIISLAASAIPNSALANSTITLGSTPISLGGSASSLNVDVTGSAGSAANLSGGATGALPYQSSSFVTSFITANSSATDEVLVSHGTGSGPAPPYLTNTPALNAENMTNYPPATASTFGVVEPDGTTCTVTAGVLTCNGRPDVTSVAATVPSWLTVTGSPITSSGTLAISPTIGLPANEFLATPNGSTGSVGLRAIVAADIPILNQSTTGTAANLSGTPALPNGTTATTQTAGDNTDKLATDAYVLATALSLTGGSHYQVVTYNGANTVAGSAALADVSSVPYNTIPITQIVSYNNTTGVVVLAVNNSFPAGGGTPLMLNIGVPNALAACNYIEDSYPITTTAATSTTITFTDASYIGALPSCAGVSASIDSYVEPIFATVTNIVEDSSNNVTLTMSSTAGIVASSQLIASNLPASFAYLNTIFTSQNPVTPTVITPTTITFVDTTGHGSQASATASASLFLIPQSLTVNSPNQSLVINTNHYLKLNGAGGVWINQTPGGSNPALSAICHPTSSNNNGCIIFDGYYPDGSRGYDWLLGYDNGSSSYYQRTDVTGSIGSSRFSMYGGPKPDAFWFGVPAGMDIKLSGNYSDGGTVYDTHIDFQNFINAGKGSGTFEFPIMTGTAQIAATQGALTPGDSVKVDPTGQILLDAPPSLPLAGGTLTGPLNGTSAVFGQLNGAFHTSFYPSNGCTVNGVTTTTAISCAYETWLSLGGASTTLYVDAGSWPTDRTLVLANGGNTLSIQGAGFYASKVYASQSLNGPVFDMPAASKVGAQGTWNFRDIWIDPNYLASSCADFVGSAANIDISNVHCLERTDGTSDHFMEIGDGSAPNQGGWMFQAHLSNIAMDPSQAPGHSGNGAVVSISVDGNGQLTYNITNGGTGYVNPKLMLNGYGKGSLPCSTMPTTSVTTSGGVITGITETVASAGCAGNVYGWIYDMPNASYALKLYDLTDSTIHDLTVSGGSVASVYTTNGEVKFISPHFGSLGPTNQSYMSPVGLLAVGRGSVWGANCGENGRYCMDIEGQNTVTDTMFYSAIQQGGQSTFYLGGNSTGTVITNLLCNIGQVIGDYHLIVVPGQNIESGGSVPNGDIVTNAQSCSGAGPSFPVYNTPTIVYGYRIPYSTTAGWVKIGTWVFNQNIANFSGSSLEIDAQSKQGNDSSFTKVVLRAGNGSQAPNITPILATGYTTNSAGGTSSVANAIQSVAVVATGGSTSITNNSWDVYINTAAFSGGSYEIHAGYLGAWTPSAAFATPTITSTTGFQANVSNVTLNPDGTMTVGGINTTNVTDTGVKSSPNLATDSNGKVIAGAPALPLTGGTLTGSLSFLPSVDGLPTAQVGALIGGSQNGSSNAVGLDIFPDGYAPWSTAGIDFEDYATQNDNAIVFGMSNVDGYSQGMSFVSGYSSSYPQRASLRGNGATILAPNDMPITHVDGTTENVPSFECGSNTNPSSSCFFGAEASRAVFGYVNGSTWIKAGTGHNIGFDWNESDVVGTSAKAWFDSGASPLNLNTLHVDGIEGTANSNPSGVVNIYNLSSGNFSGPFRALSPNATAPGITAQSIPIGTNCANSRECMALNLYHGATLGTSNVLQLGYTDEGGILNLFGTGDVSIGGDGSTDSGYKFTVNGTSRFTGAITANAVINAIGGIASTSTSPQVFSYGNGIGLQPQYGCFDNERGCVGFDGTNSVLGSLGNSKGWSLDYQPATAVAGLGISSLEGDVNGNVGVGSMGVITSDPIYFTPTGSGFFAGPVTSPTFAGALQWHTTSFNNASGSPYVSCIASSMTGIPTYSAGVVTFPGDSLHNGGSLTCTDSAGGVTIQTIPNTGGTTQTFNLTSLGTAGTSYIKLTATGTTLSTPTGGFNWGGGSAIQSSSSVCQSNGTNCPATISNVQVTMPTSSIAANSCTAPATAVMTGLTTTSTFTLAFATNPTGVVGWGSSGGLVLDMWPSANTLNWSVCNQTSVAITPGSMTMNVGAR